MVPYISTVFCNVYRDRFLYNYRVQISALFFHSLIRSGYWYRRYVKIIHSLF